MERCLQDIFASSLETPTSSNQRRGRKWYFERLEVHPIKCNVTLIPKAGTRDVESSLSPGRIRMAATLGVNFMDINNVPLKISALTFQNALLTPGTLMGHITRRLISSVSCPLHPTTCLAESAGFLQDTYVSMWWFCSIQGLDRAVNLCCRGCKQLHDPVAVCNQSRHVVVLLSPPACIKALHASTFTVYYRQA